MNCWFLLRRIKLRRVINIDFYTIKQLSKQPELITQEATGQDSRIKDLLTQAIQDECAFNLKQAKHILKRVYVEYHKNTYEILIDKVKEESYFVREVINLE